MFEAALQRLAAVGAVLVDVKKPPPTKTLDETTVHEYEFTDGIEKYLATRDGGPKTLAALIAINEQQCGPETADFGQELFIAANARGPLSNATYPKPAIRISPCRPGNGTACRSASPLSATPRAMRS